MNRNYTQAIGAKLHRKTLKYCIKMFQNEIAPAKVTQFCIAASPYAPLCPIED